MQKKTIKAAAICLSCFLPALRTEPIFIAYFARFVNPKQEFNRQGAKNAKEQTPSAPILAPLASWRFVFSRQLRLRLLVDVATMTHGHYADQARLAVNGVNDAIATNSKLAKPLEFSKERFTAVGSSREIQKGSLDGPPQIWMKLANTRRDVSRYVEPKERHARRLFLTGTSGSPKTSSKVSPAFPAR